MRRATDSIFAAVVRRYWVRRAKARLLAQFIPEGFWDVLTLAEIKKIVAEPYIFDASVNGFYQAFGSFIQDVRQVCESVDREQTVVDHQLVLSSQRTPGAGLGVGATSRLSLGPTSVEGERHPSLA